LLLLLQDLRKEREREREKCCFLEIQSSIYERKRERESNDSFDPREKL